MSKKRFIQTVIARCLPSPDKRQAALDYAEDLWEWLTQTGYGADQPSTPREARRWSDQFTPRQQQSFKAFWDAFSYKKGLQRAAMRWAQLGELSQDEYRAIIDAAKQEAQRPVPPGQARKMAEGWLFERRWEDHAKPAADPAKQRALELNRLRNELVGLNGLYSTSREPSLLLQIEKIEQQINTLRNARQGA
ncbi:MAG: hypothetical protein M8364_16685 [Methylobacter sp.]|uniref:hypothetical protein n=1 Tax=Methylobacter sp. TaxID=2051955 RepID=UPI002585AB41|nr:hypothetical protein [Methylobacter sp.]MCL7422529.1 hypothetical protein [Methylobacter sp.]